MWELEKLVMGTGMGGTAQLSTAEILPVEVEQGHGIYTCRLKALINPYGWSQSG